MKGRAFAAVVLSVLLLLSGLGIGGWWLLWQRGPLQLSHHPLTMPRAARFVPASASFSFYLFSDGQRPVDYARAVAPARQRRHAGEAIARLRDGAFAAAGLSYHDELAGWLGDELAMALFDDPIAAATGAVDQPARGWLIALSSRDDDGARRFLQRFWQTRSLAGTDLQVSSYRGMGLISGRGALLGRSPEPLATALVDDDLVLIASGRNLLERALDVSQIAALNQAGQPQLRQGIASFSTGAALAVASPASLHDWLGLPALEVAALPATTLPAATATPTAASRPGSVAVAKPMPDGNGTVPKGVAERAAPSREATPPGETAGSPAAAAQVVRDGSEETAAESPAPQAESPGAPKPDDDGLAAAELAAGPAAVPAPDRDAVAATAAEPAASPVVPGVEVAAAAPSAPAVPPVSSFAGGPSVLAVLQPQGRQLELRARLAFPGAPRLAPLPEAIAQDLLEGLRGNPASLALLQDPAALGREPLLRPLLERSLGLRSEADAARFGPLPALLAGSVHGPLLASGGEDGWLLASRADDPAAEALAPLLRQEGLLEAPLVVDGHDLQVWTHLSLSGRGGRRDRSAGAEQLQAPLAGWREQRQSLAWWGQTLAVLDAPAQSRSLSALRQALQALNVPSAPLQWGLDGDGARALLRSWQPWRLLSALAGGGLDDPVRGLALAVESQPEASALELRARLNLGD